MLREYPFNTETIPAEQYLKLTHREKLDIESCEIIPCKLGDDHSGKFKIKYKYPKYLENPL